MLLSFLFVGIVMSIISENIVEQYFKKKSRKIWLGLIYTMSNKIFHRNNQPILHPSEESTTIRLMKIFLSRLYYKSCDL